MLGSDAFFRRLVESSGDGVWAFDAEGRTVFANQRLADLLGYSVAELSDMAVADVLDEEGRAQFRVHLEELARRGPNADDAECVYRRKDGTAVPLTVGEHAVMEEGRLVCYVHRVTDDLRRRDLLSELSLSRSRLDEAQAIARLGSWEMDLATGEVTFSRQMYVLLGLDPDRDVPSPRVFFEHVVDADRAVVRQAISRAHREGGEFAFDARVHRHGHSGPVVWLRGLGRYKVDVSGRPRFVGGTLQDVTEVKEAELQLVDAVVLNTLMQVMAAAANEARTLVEAVEAVRAQLLEHDDWIRAVGFTVSRVEDRHELLPYLGPKTDPDRMPTDHERQLAERVLAARDTVFDESVQPRTPSVAFPVEADDEPAMVVVITTASPFERHEMLRGMTQQVARQLSTVAERERATQALAEARDAAMQASHLKSHFLATMSHEIRTPMNGVIGLNDLLLRTDLDDHQRRLATGMQSAGRSLLGVINDILDFSKIEAGQLELESVDFTLEAIIEQTLAVLAGVAADKHLEITTRLDPGIPARLVGDPTRLGQVVSNLVSNAVKFTHHGHVDIRATVTDVHAEGLELTVEVADTGVGIPPEVRVNLFEPFRQADASTNRTFGGTGLGLAICHQLVEAMGGRIGVSSEPGHGSTFWFAVPLGRGSADAESEGSAPATPAVAGLVAHRGHVLVVEDNHINQLVALGLLEALGYDATAVDNGFDAVEAIRSRDFDAVLMDIQMPGMDGYAAAGRIRELEPEHRRTPVVAMTASAMQDERERCLAAGMDDYLSKPVASHRLESVLNRLLGPAAVGVAASQVEEESAAEVGREPVLDERRLEELDALGPGAVTLVTRAIVNFIRDAPGTLAELETASGRGDRDRVVALAHRLKGSAWNLGALRVGAECERLEHEAPSAEPGEIDRRLAAVRDALQEAARTLRVHRGLDEDPPVRARAG